MSGHEDLSGDSDWRLLRVQAGERVLWLCVVNPELWTYVYIPDSGRFHLNKGVFVDYVWDNELTYVPVGIDEARGLIEARVGQLPSELPFERRRRYLTAEHLEVEDVLAHLAERNHQRE